MISKDIFLNRNIENCTRLLSINQGKQ